MKEMRALTLLALCGCHYYTLQVDAGPTDGGAEAEASSAAWLALCDQYFMQPGFGSATCTNCRNTSCGSELTTQLSACTSDTDSLCGNQCGASPPYTTQHCTCLQGCLTAGCQAKYPPLEQCELTACSTSCQ